MIINERTSGDCIDCHQCVNVCPTGIDIRNGTQLDCINCTACIDVCDFMMEKVNLPKGLIRYASENGIAEGKKLTFTPKIKAYSALLVVLLCVLTALLITRKQIDAHITRTGGQLYQELPDNKISNLYNAKIINKTNKDIPVEMKLEGINGEVKFIGKSEKIVVGLYKNGEKIGTVKTKFLGPFI